MKVKRVSGEHILDTINFEREQLGYQEEGWLRKHGWNHTSNTPGTLWLWVKEIKGVMYCVEKNTALHIERNARWFTS